MPDRNGYIGRAPSDSAVTVEDRLLLPLELQLILHLQLDMFQVILMFISMVQNKLKQVIIPLQTDRLSQY